MKGLSMLTKMLAGDKSDNGPLFAGANTPEVRRAKAWLEAQFRRSEKTGGFTIDNVEITPVLAEVMLTCNTLNRTKRPSYIDRLSNVNKEGRWLPGASTIRFDTNRTMADGQHRAFGAIASGKPLVIDVRFGIPPEARRIIDSHGKRTGGDILTLEGFANSRVLAAAGRLLYMYEMGHARSNITIENDVLYEFVRDRPELEVAIHSGMRMNRAFRCSTAAPGVAHYLFHKAGAPHEIINVFFTNLMDGLGFKSKRDPIYVMREFIKIKQGVGGWGTSSSYPLLGALINTWNAYAANEKIRDVSTKAGEPFPVVNPWNGGL